MEGKGSFVGCRLIYYFVRYYFQFYFLQKSKKRDIILCIRSRRKQTREEKKKSIDLWKIFGYQLFLFMTHFICSSCLPNTFMILEKKVKQGYTFTTSVSPRKAVMKCVLSFSITCRNYRVTPVF